MNQYDDETPYITQFFGKKWCYIKQNLINDKLIKDYLLSKKRKCKCDCLDGCMNPKTCPCYRYNNKLRMCTY